MKENGGSVAPDYFFTSIFFIREQRHAQELVLR